MDARFLTRLRQPLGRLMRVHGHSMLPLLRPGALVFVDELAYAARAPRRGDVVAARPRAFGGRAVVKRIVGLPSEDVADGQRTWRLGADDYLLVGDARDDSLDSRTCGPVGRHELIGRVWLRAWPPSRLTRGRTA